MGRNLPKEADVRKCFAQKLTPIVDWCDVARMTIDMLPDVALLEIYVDETWVEEWYVLVHVCRKWRYMIFRSPCRLNLRLYCKARTPVRETIEVWPPLPIVIRVYGYEMWGADNIMAALEHNDRIFQLDLIDFPSSQFGEVLAAMQRPMPALTRLHLGIDDETVLVEPDSFLGGSAPRLQTLTLDRIPFPGLPNLLYPPDTLSIWIFVESLIPGTFQLRRWSLASPS
jgi:hypothetical protein